VNSDESRPADAQGQARLPGRPRGATLTIKPGAPLEIQEKILDLDSAPDEFRDRTQRVGKTLRAYLKAVRTLLDGRYKHLAAETPRHMTSACIPYAFIFKDGILVRYDLQNNPELKVAVGTVPDHSLTDFSAAVSEQFLHCSEDPSKYDPGDRAIKLTLSAIPSAGGKANDFFTLRIFAVTSISTGRTHPTDPSPEPPMPLISVRNEVEVFLNIELDRQPGEENRQFLLRTPIRLAVGWEAIEVFPPYEETSWSPELASFWAERDLLAAVLHRNLRDNHFRKIDPHAQARSDMTKLLSECKALLDGPEESLHQFVKGKPGLLCPTHDRVWSKLPLGKRVTDFVFRQATGEYLLVELERPSHNLFRADGQQREELTHAIDQVMDWRRYIEDNLRTVQSELGLDGISSNPSCLIVIGRSSSLNPDTRRKLVTLQNATPNLRIITYDDLIANAKAAAENILGPLWDVGPRTEVYQLPSK
jgi:hypothetical protein